MFAPDLGLWNDELQGVAVVGACDGVVKNADGLEQMSDDLHFAREVRGVRNNLLGLRLELHALIFIAALVHGGLDAGHPAPIIRDFVNVGVEHVCAAVDCGQASEALW